MRSLNLYFLSREVEETIISAYEKILSGREENLRIHIEEINMIKSLVYNFRFYKANPYCYESWFYSFKIPQIGKEFDLLKISHEEGIINIELKSQDVPLERIEKQLIQNRYYLSHISEKIYSFTVVKSNNKLKVFKYYDNGLHTSSMDEMVRCINLFSTAVDAEIESMFKPTDYLVSPLNSPDKFLEEKYFLNNQQKQIKQEIINGLNEGPSLRGIKGEAGTGKTLLLYDIAKCLGKNKSVIVVHCGSLSEGHEYLDKHLEKVSVISAKELSDGLFFDKPLICVDETQRLYKSDLDIIITAFLKGEISGAVFSYDSKQALSKKEVRRNNPERLRQLDGFVEYKLTEIIRTNKEISSFIRCMLRLYDKPASIMHYENIDIIYANNIMESDTIVSFYLNAGYDMISFTPSQYKPNSIDHYSGYKNSHHVIGQEFDKVIMVLDKNFRYSEEGELEGKEHPNPDYLFPRLFYQNISRAREKLCLVVLDNKDLFEKLIRIKCPE